jgi:hypothetical protein
MTDQYLRKCSLIVSTGTAGLDLSAFKIVFRTQQMDEAAPNLATIRIYNLADTDAQKIQTEFQQVTLQAGYQTGNFAIIFQGQIMQVKRGRESAIDSYVDIMASDTDTAWNFGLLNQTLAKGSSPQQRFNAIVAGAAKYGASAASGAASGLSTTGGVLPRGKVLFGLARDQLTTLTDSQLASWSIQNGQVVVVPETGYLPGEAVKINSRTGLVSVPEATQDGIELRVLLNPYIRIGTRVQLNQAEINTTTVRAQGFPAYSDVSFFASTANDGFYRVLVAEHSGDTRGQEWYTKLVCLAVDSSASPAMSVKAG